jgi:hypothetical protein
MTTQHGVAARVLSDAYGPGAWHGPDLKAALADLDASQAFARPAPGRHNVAEIALHHAYTTRAVRAQLSGKEPEPFVLAGEDWFEVPGEGTLKWTDIQRVVRSEHDRLTSLVRDIESGNAGSPLAIDERFKLILGITCHAVYHAGQIQLIKRLQEAAA